jgi:hypothetical protein
MIAVAGAIPENQLTMLLLCIGDTGMVPGRTMRLLMKQ